jgi:hypothetical protein
LLIPVSKHRISASYDLISLGLSGLIFSLFHLTQARLPLLSAWGQNPILLYLLQYGLLLLFLLPSIPAWYIEAPLWLTGVQAITLVGILSWVAYKLRKRNFVFSL